MAKNQTRKRGITPRQRRAIASLVTDGNVAAAAKAAGATRDTVYRWLRDECFRHELHSEELRAMEDFSRALVSVAEKATQAIREALDDENVWVRLRAASMVMDGILRAREALQLEQRVKELEDIVHAYTIKQGR